MRQTDTEKKTQLLSVFGSAATAAAKNTYRFLSRNPVKTIARVVVTLLFVYLVNRGVGRNDLALLAEAVSPGVLLLAILLGALSLYLQVVRWQVILRAHQLPSGGAIAAKTMFKGFLLAFVTPGRVGELFRAVDLSPGRKKETVLAVFEERFFGIAAIVCTGVCALLIEVTVLRQTPFYPLLIASGLFVIAVVVAVKVITGNGRLLSALENITGFGDILKALHLRVVSYPYPALAALSIGAQLCLIGEAAVLLKMFGAGSLPHAMIGAAEAYSFMLLLPFFIANIGLREYSFSFFMVRLTDNPLLLSSMSRIALGGATAILVFNIVIPAAIGLVWMYRDKKDGGAAEPEQSSEHGTVSNGGAESSF